MRLLTIALMAVALLAGAYLRFDDLGAREVSADEAASWAAASAPTAAEVLHRQARLNPGKLGVHDLALHYWMPAFGDSAMAMRALSAAAGTVAIVLVFLLAQELLQITSVTGAAPVSANLVAHERDLIAAIGALIFAVNLVTIKYAREARMYPLVLAFTIAQVWFFLRASRIGRFGNYLAVAIFTALAVATNLTATVILVPEAAWIILMILRGNAERRFAHALKLIAALAAGLVAIVPLAIPYLQVRSGPTNPQAYAWIPMPALYAPVALFNKATGTFAFPVMAALALWGVVSGWDRVRGAVIFAILWMFVPPLAALAFSYAVQPAFLERYLISCFVPFFLLGALGAWQLRYRWAQAGAVVTVVALALGHVASYDRRPHDVQWREAAIIATCNVSTDGAVAVAPGYAVNVVRYYLRRGPAVEAVSIDEPDDAQVAIVADQGVAPERADRLRHDYTRLLMHLRGVTILQR
jgi:uncharacterized membrane protein